jgi:anti-sigma-K factor RskA
MSEQEDRDALAAEYVLGTLDREERAQALALIEADPAFAEQVRRWERRLGALNVMVDEVEPPPDLFERIRARVGGAPPSEGMRLPPVANEAARAAPQRAKPSDGGADIIRWSRRLNRERRVASAFAALAALLAIFLALAEFKPGVLPAALRPRVETASLPQQPASPPSPPAGRYVAVLQKDASQPAFLLTVDLDRRTLVIRRVAAEREPGKSFELWLVSEKFPGPRSLGVVEGDEFTQRPTLAAYDRDTIDGATYAISLEPEGGSPTGTPTGPVLYLGKLVEATPAAAAHATKP